MDTILVETNKINKIMKTVDFIISYLKTEATPAELYQIRTSLLGYTAPPIVAEVVLGRMLDVCRNKWTQEVKSKLEIIKYVKDVTGWGLKECKDWVEINVTNKNSSYEL
jgi:hypothetical protein